MLNTILYNRKEEINDEVNKRKGNISTTTPSAAIIPRPVARRLGMMREKHILQFTILTDLSSIQLTGFIEFVVLIRVHASYHHNVVQRIYNEMVNAAASFYEKMVKEFTNEAMTNAAEGIVLVTEK
jgi:hypothetical protein